MKKFFKVIITAILFIISFHLFTQAAAFVTKSVKGQWAKLS